MVLEMEINTNIPTFEYLERYDGSRWTRYELPAGGELVVTSRGRELLSYNRPLRRMLLSYKEEVRKNQENGEIRNWFRAGGNSDVYLVGDRPLVMKEASTSQSVWSALDRMDYLHGICLRNLPAHIRVPDHFALLDSPNLNRQYLLIQKVNDGVTVADLKLGEEEYGRFMVSDHLRDTAINAFENLEDQVQTAIEATTSGWERPSNLLPDWDAGNVVVDFYTPTRQMPFTFWIIDQ